MLRNLIFNLKSMFLLMVCFLLISNALCSDNENKMNKEIEEMMDISSDKPSDKAIKGFIDYVECLFGIELDNDQKGVLKQQFIYLYQQNEFDCIDAWQSTRREKTEGIKLYLEAIKSEGMQGESLWNSKQGTFCISYEQRKEEGIKDPAYELIHELCIDLFGDHYLSPGAKKIFIAGVEGVTYPERIPESFVRPKYPRKAKKTKTEGMVILQIVVKKNGRVKDLKVLRSPPKKYGFGKSAMKAVKRWRYKPATKNGQPVDAYLTVQVIFVLK